jgi:hypothetical protein
MIVLVFFIAFIKGFFVMAVSNNSLFGSGGIWDSKAPARLSARAEEISQITEDLRIKVLNSEISLINTGKQVEELLREVNQSDFVWIGVDQKQLKGELRNLKNLINSEIARKYPNDPSLAKRISVNVVDPAVNAFECQLTRILNSVHAKKCTPLIAHKKFRELFLKLDPYLEKSQAEKYISVFSYWFRALKKLEIESNGS